MGPPPWGTIGRAISLRCGRWQLEWGHLWRCDRFRSLAVKHKLQVRSDLQGVPIDGLIAIPTFLPDAEVIYRLLSDHVLELRGKHDYFLDRVLELGAGDIIHQSERDLRTLLLAHLGAEHLDEVCAQEAGERDCTKWRYHQDAVQPGQARESTSRTRRYQNSEVGVATLFSSVGLANVLRLN